MLVMAFKQGDGAPGGDTGDFFLDGTDFVEKNGTGITVTPTNTVISSDQAKFGSTSYALGLSGASQGYLTFGDDPLWTLGTGDWTVDFWIYLKTIPSFGMMFFLDSPETLQITYGSAFNAYGFQVGAINDYNDGGTPVTNQWVHIAVERFGNTATQYIDGTSTGNTYDTTAVTFADPAAATFGKGGSGWSASMWGYMDHFRLTKGTARYQGNFTPPTAGDY